MNPIRILIADDHSLLRAGLRSLLANLDGFEVVGEAADGREALDLIESLKPDVALVDISMPGMTGLDVTARVVLECGETKVVIVSMHKESAFVQHSLSAGAMGYLLKDCGTHELESAIRAVMRGETYLSPSISGHVVTDLLRGAHGSEGARKPLTQRQLDVLRMIAQGTTTKAIAHRLGISAKTVETHRAQIMERLNIHDVAGLVRYAIRMGMISPEV
jgi:DNA-binding NarL/FixJ family response regulator